VALVGDFNGWSTTADPMTRRGELWSCTLRLAPGEYAFTYVVDGEWITPAVAEELAADGFGGWNGKISVR
jgi:1,4-alpha-glucan branching enzyme